MGFNSGFKGLMMSVNLVGKPGGMSPLGRPGVRWKDFKKWNWSIDWIDLAKERNR